VLKLAGLSLNEGVRVVIWASAASLGFWGGIAARRAGLGGRGTTHAAGTSRSG